METKITRVRISAKVYDKLKAYQSKSNYSMSFIIDTVLKDALLDESFLLMLLDDETLFRIEKKKRRRAIKALLFSV